MILIMMIMIMIMIKRIIMMIKIRITMTDDDDDDEPSDYLYILFPGAIHGQCHHVLWTILREEDPSLPDSYQFETLESKMFAK